MTREEGDAAFFNQLINALVPFAREAGVYADDLAMFLFEPSAFEQMPRASQASPAQIAAERAKVVAKLRAYVANGPALHHDFLVVLRAALREHGGT